MRQLFAVRFPRVFDSKVSITSKRGIIAVVIRWGMNRKTEYWFLVSKPISAEVTII